MLQAEAFEEGRNDKEGSQSRRKGIERQTCKGKADLELQGDSSMAGGETIQCWEQEWTNEDNYTYCGVSQMHGNGNLSLFCPQVMGVANGFQPEN